jgi:hypothetical protein
MRLWVTGLFMFLGSVGALLLVSDNYLLAAGMGSVFGALASLMVRTYPRDHDYAHNNDDFFSKN